MSAADQDQIAAHPAEDDKRGSHHDLPAHGHNPSRQAGVDENPDLTLHYSHEHQHTHLHHNRASLAGRQDDVLYAEGTTYDRSNIGDQGPQDYNTHHLRAAPVDEKDFIAMEGGKATMEGPTGTNVSEDEGQGRSHRISRAYSKYKIFVHLFIWLFFTG